MMDGMKSEVISEQEADLYDRQIRLWGIESQKRLRAADVLLIGIRPLGCEIAKNILLSGIKSLTILDDGIITKQDLLTNFLLEQDSVGQNFAEACIKRASKLNPMVKLVPDKQSIKDKDEMFYKSFTLIIATRLSGAELISLDQICRQHEIQFFAADVFGFFGFSFADLLIYEYLDEVKQMPSTKRKHGEDKKALEPVITRTMRTVNYIPLQDALFTDWADEDTSKIKTFSPLYYLLRVLLIFRNTYGREVDYSQAESELEKLREIRNKLFNKFGLESTKLPDSLFDLIFEENVATCACVGGVVAHAVIKALTHVGLPLNNFFFFDPLTYCGRVEYVTV